MFDAQVAAYMQTLLEGSLAHIRERTRHDDPQLITHHHGETDHMAFLERPFREALDAIKRRRTDPSDVPSTVPRLGPL